jgi:hypothetical protein
MVLMFDTISEMIFKLVKLNSITVVVNLNLICLHTEV